MASSWVERETNGADLGDERLNDRLAVVMAALAKRPHLSIPAACGGRSETEAAYRFFANDKTTFENVLAPHRERTRERLAAQKVVLLVQDTTEVDLTRSEREVRGAGDLDGMRRGFLLHAMQAFTPDGTPLGMAWAEIINRAEPAVPASKKTRSERARTPIEEKESLRWLTGLRKARELAQYATDTQCVVVADSEADVYEVFAEPRGARPVDWLIRAGQDRALGDDAGHVRAAVAAARVRYRTTVTVRGRRSSFDDRETRRRRQPRRTRRAKLEVRTATVTLRPAWRGDRKLPPVTVNVVLASERNPPAGEPAVEWLLLTTLPIATDDDVRRVVDSYRVRWMIEVFFRTLKSGCRVEARRFEYLDRVMPYLAICLMVAWRTLLVSRLGRREEPTTCEVVFTAAEWNAVWAVKVRKPLPKRPPRLRDVVRWTATLGGFIDRKGKHPGTQTLWLGLQRVHDLASAWEAFGPPTQKPSS